MKNQLRNIIIIAVLSISGTIALINYASVKEPEVILTSTAHDVGKYGINTVKLEFTNNMVVLNISLDSPITCRQAIDILGIQDLLIKGRAYSPQCVLVEPAFIRIAYKETKMV